MDRRSFFKFAAMALAGTQAKRVWPFRVYSIPEIVVPAQTIEIYGALNVHPAMERIQMISMRAYKVPVKWGDESPYWLADDWGRCSPADMEIAVNRLLAAVAPLAIPLL